MACGILVPCPGIKLVPSAGEVQNFFFFFFAIKSFIVSIWSKAWEKAPGC